VWRSERRGLRELPSAHLDFYDKGVTVETNVQVLDYLEDVGPRFADVVVWTRCRPGAQPELLRARQAVERPLGAR
jgi:hypothetical protein